MQSNLGLGGSIASSVLSYRTTKSNEGKLVKKVEALMKDYKGSISTMRKKAIIYYISKETQKISWQVFL
jgi:hypothetical protein